MFSLLAGRQRFDQALNGEVWQDRTSMPDAAAYWDWQAHSASEAEWSKHLPKGDPLSVLT